MRALRTTLFAFLTFFGGFFAFYIVSRSLDIPLTDLGAKITPGEELTATPINARLDRREPQYYYLNKGPGVKPKVTAHAYIVGDLGTGEVILAQNEAQKMPIASISKLMTALVASEISKENEVAKVSKRAVATVGGNGGLKAGENIKVQDLVYPLLMESSNDAAEVIAEHFGRPDFIAQMNAGAASLKMTDTSFEDPSGLSENNRSTAADIFKLAGYLKRQKENVWNITTRKSYSAQRHYWSNISQFLSKEGYLGGKSGYIDEAGQTVVSVFSLPLGESSQGGKREKIYRPVAITLLKSKDRARDVENILNYVKKYIFYGGVADANTDWIREKLYIPVIEPNYVDMIFTGDLMLDRGVRSSVNKNLSGDYGALFEKVAKYLKQADIVFGNLEGTASDKGEDIGNLYSFHMDPAVVPALKAAGFHIVSMANNHIGDWGREAFTDTLLRLKENEILYTGGGMNSLEAEEPTIFEKNGMKIGFLGFSDVGPIAMEATEERPGHLLAADPRFEEIIKNASAKVDYLIVSFHWGTEYKPIHNARQEELAHKAIDNGAKIIVGHHPHVAQDTEIYKNAYIMYSLGNFIFDQKWSEPTMQGLMVKIRLDKQGGLTVTKNVTKLNKFFQIGNVIPGKEEKIKFPVLSPVSSLPEQVTQ